MGEFKADATTGEFLERVEAIAALWIQYGGRSRQLAFGAVVVTDDHVDPEFSGVGDLIKSFRSAI